MKYLFYIFLLVISGKCFGQSFLNGDFENNTAGVDQINLSNAAFNSFMADCYGFGTYENLDIITSSTYSGGPQNGNWFVALTGGGTDMLSIKLSTPLVVGSNYVISFFDKSDDGFISLPLEIGLSGSNNNFGALIYTTSNPAIIGIWTQRIFSFIAPFNGEYIVVRQQGSISNWVNIDNFSFDTCSFNINLGFDTTLCQGEMLTLNATTTNATYKWQDNSTNPTFDVSQQGTYWVSVNVNNCIKTDTFIIYPKNCDIILEMPNIFTPNNDGINDYFCPIEMDAITYATLIIYNRWGLKLFETNNLLTGWDGKYDGRDCSDGTYYWIVKYSGKENNEKVKNGFLTLIR